MEISTISNYLKDFGVMRCCSAAAAFLVASFIATAIYNILFSPLRKFPGPKLAAASVIPYWYNTLSGHSVSWTKSLHEKYGDVVRIAPDRLSYINPEAWRDIYGHRTAGHKANPKDPRTYRREKTGVYSIVSEPNDQRHGEVRKIFSNAFSERALKLQESLIMRSVDKLIGNIHAAINNDPKVRLDIVKLYNCTTFDIMGELTFGETLGLLDKSEYSPWVSAIFQSVKAIEFGRLSLDYPILRRIMDIVLPAKISKGEDEHYKYSSDRVDRRLEKGANQADIWNLVLHKNEGVLNLDEMHANGMVFMIAGTETTATLLSGLTYSLLTNPDKLQKAVEEVRYLPEDQLNLEVLPRLKYLSACFDEGFRTYPPVPTAMLRVVPEGGNVICGEWVPAKTRIGVPQYVAYHSASNFKDPDSFVPERWLPGTGYDDDKKEVLQPFLYGPRNCIGKNLAYHEMRLIFSKILWHFDLSLCSESREWTDQKAWALWDKPPLWINAKKVERN